MIYILHDREGVKEKTEKTKNFNSYSNNNLCFGGLEEEESEENNSNSNSNTLYRSTKSTAIGLRCFVQVEEQNRTATESAIPVQPATTTTTIFGVL